MYNLHDTWFRQKSVFIQFLSALAVQFQIWATLVANCFDWPNEVQMGWNFYSSQKTHRWSSLPNLLHIGLVVWEIWIFLCRWQNLKTDSWDWIALHQQVEVSSQVGHEVLVKIVIISLTMVLFSCWIINQISVHTRDGIIHA